MRDRLRKDLVLNTHGYEGGMRGGELGSPLSLMPPWRKIFLYLQLVQRFQDSSWSVNGELMGLVLAPSPGLILGSLGNPNSLQDKPQLSSLQGLVPRYLWLTRIPCCPAVHTCL